MFLSIKLLFLFDSVILIYMIVFQNLKLFKIFRQMIKQCTSSYADLVLQFMSPPCHFLQCSPFVELCNQIALGYKGLRNKGGGGCF